jgi:chemotaxis protein histidine kinase CheA
VSPSAADHAEEEAAEEARTKAPAVSPSAADHAEDQAAEEARTKAPAVSPSATDHAEDQAAEEARTKAPAVSPSAADHAEDQARDEAEEARTRAPRVSPSAADHAEEQAEEAARTSGPRVAPSAADHAERQARVASDPAPEASPAAVDHAEEDARRAASAEGDSEEPAPGDRFAPPGGWKVGVSRYAPLGGAIELSHDDQGTAVTIRGGAGAGGSVSAGSANAPDASSAGLRVRLPAKGGTTTGSLQYDLKTDGTNRVTVEYGPKTPGTLGGKPSLSIDDNLATGERTVTPGGSAGVTLESERSVSVEATAAVPSGEEAGLVVDPGGVLSGDRTPNERARDRALTSLAKDAAGAYVDGYRWAWKAFGPG